MRVLRQQEKLGLQMFLMIWWLGCLSVARKFVIRVKNGLLKMSGSAKF